MRDVSCKLISTSMSSNDIGVEKPNRIIETDVQS